MLSMVETKRCPLSVTCTQGMARELAWNPCTRLPVCRWTSTDIIRMYESQYAAVLEGLSVDREEWMPAHVDTHD